MHLMMLHHLRHRPLVASVLVSCPPVVIGPGGNFGFVQTSPSGASTAMTFEMEMGYWER